MKSLFLFLLRAYKLTISPFLGQHCRFYPSCSAYADIAIRRHGVIKGSMLAGKRLCKCHPFHPGGVDLVPDSEINTEQPCDFTPKTGLKLARFSTGDLNNAANDQTIAVTKSPAEVVSLRQPDFTTHLKTHFTNE